MKFAEALEAQLRKDFLREAEGPATSGSPTSQRDFGSSEFDELPLGFAWMMGQSHAWNVQAAPAKTTTAHRAYGVKIKPPPVPKPHVLNVSQQEAMGWMSSLGISLKGHFSIEELRKAWRKAAFQSHPDHGGTAPRFLKTKWAYETLLTVFTAKAESAAA